MYPPKKLADNYAQAEVTATPSADASRVLLIPFADERADKVNVGEVRNGWGMHTADVVSKNDVVQWINDAVKLELERAGYAVTVAQGPDRPQGTTVISGEILTVFCEAMFSYEGEVSLFVTISQGDNEVLRRRYTGTGGAGVHWAATAGSYGSSLSLALADALQKVMEDMKVMLNGDSQPQPVSP